MADGQVVDRNDFVTFSAEHLTERQTANAAKTIDCNFYCHDNKPPMIYLLILYTISRKSTRGFWKKWLKDSGEFFVKSHPQGKKAGKWGFAEDLGRPRRRKFPLPPPPSGPERAGYNPGGIKKREEFLFIRALDVHFAALKAATKVPLDGPSFTWMDQDPRGPWFHYQKNVVSSLREMPANAVWPASVFLAIACDSLTQA